MSDNVREVTDATFEAEVIKSAKPVLVDFWAPWCGPCRMMAPVVDEVAAKYAGQATFLKLNVDENPQTAQTYGILAIPTLIVFKAGQPQDKMVGVVSAGKLGEAVTKAL